jgi:hypothetical protein
VLLTQLQEIKGVLVLYRQFACARNSGVSAWSKLVWPSSDFS